MNAAIGKLEMGDHAAYFYKTNAERLSFVIPFLIAGLRQNERCLYITDENSVPSIFRRLAEAGVDVEKEQKRGALSVLTKTETYLRHGLFEPAKMVTDLNSEVKVSLEHGFVGLRASGEMSWALDLPSALARLIEYEEELEAANPAEFGLLLCQYDASRFPAELVERMKLIHAVHVQDGQVVRQQPQPAYFSAKYAALARMREM